MVVAVAVTVTGAVAEAVTETESVAVTVIRDIVLDRGRYFTFAVIYRI